ncbi:MAG TPA: isochorismatase family protein [Myxococcales bacterium]
MDPLRMRLDRAKTALLVVDIQERMVAAMDPKLFPRMLNRTLALLEGAKAMGLRVVVTEQYPKGLGHTIREVVSALPEGVQAIEKLEFSCAVPAALERIGDRPQVLLCGMESHVCVFQTARDLLEKEFVPYLCADAILSRTPEDRQIGLERAREIGAVVTTTESALFDLLGKAGTPEFKRVSAAVK